MSDQYIVLRLVRAGQSTVRINKAMWEKAKQAGAVDVCLDIEMEAVATDVVIVEPDGTRLDRRGRVLPPGTRLGGCTCGRDGEQ